MDFDGLVARHRQRVIGVAFARCRDVGLAEDIAQEAFLVAWGSRDRLRDAGDPGVGRWLAGIARNLATSAARTRDRRARVVFVAPDYDAPTSEPSPEAELAEREDRALFERALADVEPAHRDILIRYYLEGRSLAAIARADGTSEVAAKKRLSRAREAVRVAVAARADRAMARLRKPMIFTPFGKAAFLMASKKLVIVGVVIALGAVGGVAWWLHGRPGPTAAVAGIASGSSTTSSTAASVDTAPSTDAARPAPADVHVGKLDRPARDALLAQIRAAHQRAAATPRPALPPTGNMVVGPGPGSSDDPIDKAFIKAAVHEILPMLADCYDEGLQRNPKLAAANVVVEFTIEGEKEIGGVIGESKIDNSATDLADATVRECIQETMYALKIDPPPGGNTVTVRYPFAFAPGPDETPAPTH